MNSSADRVSITSYITKELLSQLEQLKLQKIKEDKISYSTSKVVELVLQRGLRHEG